MWLKGYEKAVPRLCVETLPETGGGRTRVREHSFGFAVKGSVDTPPGLGTKGELRRKGEKGMLGAVNYRKGGLVRAVLSVLGGQIGHKTPARPGKRGRLHED